MHAARYRPTESVPSTLWRGYFGGPAAAADDVETGCDRERIEDILVRLTRLPASFRPHPKVVKLLDEGKIPARTLPDSRHRRILVADLDAYAARKTHRRGILGEAMNEIAEADLYLPDHSGKKRA